ncbi:MAG TPA: GNAT family N-acetyltransferase [Polyangiaceae bacterium]|jgi:RimJ/RimL family protein N-acetyltransferase|nr:GNAT family N-acetyltransferase [Polyangiaceae bacterium]
MIQIRQATIGDATALWKAEVETAQTPGRLVSRPQELTLASFEFRIRELETAGCYVVAVDDTNGLCGHALLEPMSLEALRHVFRLTVVVHPGRTGCGIGTALLTHLQDWASSNADALKIELMARATNLGAIRLYERLGFAEEGRFRDRVRLPNGDFIDDVAMAWFPPSNAG